MFSLKVGKLFKYSTSATTVFSGLDDSQTGFQANAAENLLVNGSKVAVWKGFHDVLVLFFGAIAELFLAQICHSTVLTQLLVNYSVLD
jgi:hypothetical protein